MAIDYKVLGQANPLAATATDLYTVPAGKQTIVSTISICNLSAGELAFRIAVRVNGAALEAKQYIAFDSKVAGNDTTFVTVGPTLNAGDVITVRAASTDLAFSVFGSEIA